MTSEQQTLVRNVLQQVVDVAVARTIWTVNPLVAAALGGAAFAILWWLAQ